jgi:hypothetical protein
VHHQGFRRDDARQRSESQPGRHQPHRRTSDDASNAAAVRRLRRRHPRISQREGFVPSPMVYVQMSVDSVGNLSGIGKVLKSDPSSRHPAGSHQGHSP